jgi:hypothetical protein
MSVFRWLSPVLAGVVLLAAASSCSSARVSDLYTAIDSEGARRRNEFFTDSLGVYCIAELASGRDDQTLEMYVRQLQDENGKTVDRIIAAAESATPKGSTGSKFIVRLVAVNAKGEPAEDLPIPTGRYRCEAKIDGNDEGSATFNVTYAPCPVAQLTPGAVCGGFIKAGTICQRYGSAGKDTTKCTCNGVWVC